jgi:undecaprenyl diphosphate synthase
MKHLAIIMDGNRRWAQQRGLSPVVGHQAGVESLRSLVELCPSYDIEYLTVYAFSTENWRRTREEVGCLFDLLIKTLRRELKDLQRQGVKLRFIGDLFELSREVRHELRQAEKATSHCRTLTLQVAVNYGSRGELVQATRKLAESASRGELDPADIDETMLARSLFTDGIPDPELLIRTGGESRLSNYLLWQVAYTEMLFVPVLWPDFGKPDLEASLEEFSKRCRRYPTLMLLVFSLVLVMEMFWVFWFTLVLFASA